jgi:thiol-disulfide isomerase/thioredoxin
VDLPNVGDDQDASRFVFFQPVTQPAAVDGAVGGVSEQTQQLVESLEKIDEQLTRARGEAETKRLNDQRADVLEKLAAAAANETDRRMWLMQFADTVGAAAQSGTYPEGTTRLAALRKDLEADSQDAELLSHVVFAHMSSEYAAQLEAADADFGEVQENWLKQLQSFIERYPTSRDAPEAMLQLALAKEFAGEDEEANKWYTRIVDDFSDWPQVEKAAGAKRRLESVGRVLTLQGPTIDGKSFDLAKQRGSMVLIQYWATWCEPCKQDMEILANLQRQYARQGLKIVGVNLDQDRAGLARYFQANKPQWPHLYEPGGMESRLADELGVFTLPLMLLVDQSGKVVNRQIQASELETEIKKLLR